MKNSRTLSIHALSLLILLVLLLAGTMTKAQQTPSNFLAGLLRGIQVDSPQVFLWWGSGNHDSLKIDPLARELKEHQKGVWDFKLQSQTRWDSIKIFDIPVDFVLLRYFWAPGQYLGLRWVGMSLNPIYIEQAKTLFLRYMGNPNKSRNSHGRFLYSWHFKGELSVYLTNRKSSGSENGNVVLLITNPRVSGFL